MVRQPTPAGSMARTATCRAPQLTFSSTALLESLSSSFASHSPPSWITQWFS
ncbi:hypothetical protein E2C01_085099 [Portunus trituberculatus]|uniref:Uncharacterized protein n=1 Tax=Portunus trituberculatus TaxID=210409 RepID=A0A5B7J026_PORTR|nr:hypothetical protein [Portunus trituberculatus]